MGAHSWFPVPGGIKLGPWDDRFQITFMLSVLRNIHLRKITASAPYLVIRKNPAWVFEFCGLPPSKRLTWTYIQARRFIRETGWETSAHGKLLPRGWKQERGKQAPHILHSETRAVVQINDLLFNPDFVFGRNDHRYRPGFCRVPLDINERIWEFGLLPFDIRMYLLLATRIKLTSEGGRRYKRIGRRLAIFEVKNQLTPANRSHKRFRDRLEKSLSRLHRAQLLAEYSFTEATLLWRPADFTADEISP